MTFHLKVTIDNIKLIIVNKEPIMLMVPSNFKLMLSFLFLTFNKNSTKDEKNIDIDNDMKIINIQISSSYRMFYISPSFLGSQPFSHLIENGFIFVEVLFIYSDILVHLNVSLMMSLKIYYNDCQGYL